MRLDGVTAGWSTTDPTLTSSSYEGQRERMNRPGRCRDHGRRAPKKKAECTIHVLYT
jgi:hypothetical protein